MAGMMGRARRALVDPPAHTLVVGALCCGARALTTSPLDRTETVETEEVVLEQEEREVTVVEMREHATERPTLQKNEVTIQRPGEVMRSVKVTRPEIEIKKVGL